MYSIAPTTVTSLKLNQHNQVGRKVQTADMPLGISYMKKINYNS